MKAKAMALEQEPTGLIELIKEYWLAISGVSTVLIGIYAFWKRKVKKRVAGMRVWLTAAASLPVTLQAIHGELQFENGVTLRQQMFRIGEDLNGIKNIIAVEITVRRSMLQTVETPMFECSKDGQLVWANNAMLKTANCELVDLEGWNWRNMIAAPDRADMTNGWTSAVAIGTDFRQRFRLMTSDIDEQWMMFDAVCVKDSAGHVVGFIGKLREARDPRIHLSE